MVWKPTPFLLEYYQVSVLAGLTSVSHGTAPLQCSLPEADIQKILSIYD